MVSPGRSGSIFFKLDNLVAQFMTVNTWDCLEFYSYVRLLKAVEESSGGSDPLTYLASSQTKCHQKHWSTRSLLIHQ